MRLSKKQKRILRWIGYPLLALFTFVIVLHLTFPYDRVVNKYLVDPLSSKYDVSFMAVERGFWPGSITIRSLSMSSLDTGPDGEGGTKLFFKEVSINLGLIALTGGKADVDFVAKMGGGSIKGNIQLSRTELAANIETSSLPLDNLGGVRSSVGLPMSGGLDASVDMVMPDFRWDKLEGTITLACPSCTIGDGKTKIKPRAPPGRRMSRNAMVFAGDGLTVPELDLGDLSGTMVIKDGRGSIDDFEASSSDGELALSAAIRFTRKISNARFDSGCMKFKLSDSLKKREPSFGNLPQFMKISPEADGFSNVRLKGLVKGMRWVPTKNCQAGGGDAGNSDRVTAKRSSLPRIKPKKSDDSEDANANERAKLELNTPKKLNLDKRKAKLGEVIKNGGDKLEGRSVKLPEPRTSGPPIDRPPSGDDVPRVPNARRVQRDLLRQATESRTRGEDEDEDEDEEDEGEDDEDDEDDEDEDEDEDEDDEDEG